MACCSRALARRALPPRPSRRPGSGLPAIEPGMPTPAGTGLDRRSVPRPRARPGARRLRRRRAAAAGVRGGHRGRRRGQPEQPRPRLASSSTAAPMRSTCSIPAADPLYRKLRPRLALAPSAGHAVRRGHRAAAGTRRSRRSRTLHARGQGQRDARRSATTTRTSRTSPRGTSGRSEPPTSASRPAGSAATSTASARADNPLQGLSLDWSLQPSLGTARMPVAAIDRPTATTSGRAASGARSATGWSARSARSARCPTHGDAGLEQATDAARQSARLYEQLAPFRPKGDAKAFTSPVPYPTRDDSFPRRLAGLAAMLAAGLPLRVVALSASGGYDTHDNQAHGARRRARSSRPTRCSPSSATSRRAGSPTACSCTSGRSSAGARKENGSGGTDHGAAGAGLPDRLAGQRAR